MAKFNFSGKQQVVLEERGSPKKTSAATQSPHTKGEMVVASVTPKKVTVVAPPALSLKGQVAAEAASSVLVGVTTKALPPIKLVEALTNILERVEIGQFRGRVAKPSVMLGLAEQQALAEMLNFAQMKLDAFLEHKEARQSLKSARVLKSKSKSGSKR